MCKEKNSIVYLYRMTHDYGTNPCCFNEAFEPTPELLTLGGCAKPARKHIKDNKWLEKGFDVYIMAIAGHSHDKVEGKDYTEDLNGIALITSNYEALMYVAKISGALTRKEYLDNQKYSDRADAIHYRSAKEDEQPSCLLSEEEEPLPVLLSNNFVYYGKNAKTIDRQIIDLFPSNVGCSPYNSCDEKKVEQTALLLSFMKDELNGEGSVMGEPYNPSPKFKFNQNCC